MENIIHCEDCRYCFKSKRSKTGYKCEKWGYDDFADDTVLDGYCHKAKPKYDSFYSKEVNNDSNR